MSSLFSSSSLSSSLSSAQTSDKDRESLSPGNSRRPSHLNISTSSSGVSTPTQSPAQPLPVAKTYGDLAAKGSEPSVNGLQNLHIDTNNSAALSQSPEASLNDPAPPALPQSSTIDEARKTGRKRTPSLYSQWDLAEAAEESSDEEDEAFLTPDEGLSEVEEEDEEQEETKVTNPTLDATNVPKGAEAATGDVLGTGPSTIRRSKPSAGETRVRTRSGVKVQANFDQAAVLGADIDACREILTLFLTSKMREAEEMCFKKDPDGNHMYLLSAHSIINGLKVRYCSDYPSLPLCLLLSDRA